MHIAPRILRAEADSFDPDPPYLTPRERAQRERILAISLGLLARHGRFGVSFTGLAIALRISPAALRRHFADLDALLATLLRDHLLQVAKALGTVPRNAPDGRRLRRLAYLKATRTACGGLTHAHLLLVRERCFLPEDERVPIETTRYQLGILIGGHLAEDVLDILDMEIIDPAQMETALAAAFGWPWPQSSHEPPFTSGDAGEPAGLAANNHPPNAGASAL